MDAQSYKKDFSGGSFFDRPVPWKEDISRATKNRPNEGWTGFPAAPDSTGWVKSGTIETPT